MVDDSLRVCLGALQYYPVYAGPAVRFRRYAPGLRSRGIEMEVFTCAVDSSPESAPPPPHDPDAPVHRAPVRYTKRPSIWLRYGPHLVRHCTEGSSRPDVVQLLAVSGWAIPSLIRLKRAGLPIVFTNTMVRDPSGASWVRSLKDLTWSTPLRLIDRVVVSSRAMRTALLDRGVAARVEVIPNGVDVDRFRPCRDKAERRALRRRLGLDPGEEIVLFVGHVNARKGVDVLAEAWPRIARERPRARLVLIDPSRDRESSDPAFVARVEATLRDSGAWDRVTWIGAVENVEDYLRAADVFAFPSRREGMPNVVPEAFASGVPVVLAPFSGLPEEFGRAGGEYILVERTPDDLSAGILRVLADAGLRRELRERGRRWATDTLSVDVSLDRYAALYRELAAARKRPAAPAS